MSVARLLASLAERGLAFHLDGEDLRFRGPAGALTEADRAELRARKAEVIAYLLARRAAVEPGLTTEGPLRASLNQEVWWRLVRSSPIQLRMEKIPLILPFPGADPDAAESAVHGLVARHHVLRSRLSKSAGPPKVALNRAEDFKVERVEVPDQAAAQVWAAEFMARPLPVDGGWLLRAAVVSVGGGITVVAMTVHHIVFDGTSMALAAGELNDRIAGIAPEGDARQFLDYARWERAWFDGGAGHVLAGWWADWLARLPQLRAPSGRNLRWEPGERVDHPLDLAPDMAERLAGAAARLKTTPFVVILGAYARALGRWSGQKHFPLRAVGDLRAAPALEGIVGLLICADVMEVEAADAGPEALCAGLAAEYRRAVEMRMPSHPAGTGAGYEEFHERIAATVNYIPSGAVRIESKGPLLSLPNPPNRPQVIPWPVPLPSIFLRLWELDGVLAGRLEFNGALIGEAEQVDLVAALLAAFDELAP